MKSIAEELSDSVLAVTKDWAAQRKREERHANAVWRRRDRLTRVRRWSIKDAAWSVMKEAYMKASGGGTLPVKPRQIMYAARPAILEMTGKDALGDSYFTQTLLNDYIEENPEAEAWDIIWDARGTFSEPHTGHQVPIGTLEVRDYLGLRPEARSSIHGIIFDKRFPTMGPEARYDTVLFIEKEGFAPLISSARVAERFDLALMSSKGMSTTAARLLLDKLSGRGVRKILVLHDFDVSGFSIFGTLGTDSRRYLFANDINLIDIGLRLKDVEQMSLQSEPVTVEGDWRPRATTLRRHGATDAEIAFLRGRRVEINAMTSQQIIEFIEAKLGEYGVTKLIPDDEAIESHARHVIEDILLQKAIDEVSKKIVDEAKAIASPENLREQIKREFKEHPEMSWDATVARIIHNSDGKVTP